MMVTGIDDPTSTEVHTYVERLSTDRDPVLAVGIHDPDSTGVHTYVERLSAALSGFGVEYRSASQPLQGGVSHFHLANSTRKVTPQAIRDHGPFLVTVHDVIPRNHVLRPFYRLLIAPRCVKGASCVIVHSRHAAAMLAGAGLSGCRMEVIPHPAPVPRDSNKSVARILLEIEPEGPPLFVLPGVLKRTKLVREILTAAVPLLSAGRLRLLLAGRVLDKRLAAAAKAAGAIVLRDPAAAAYENAIVAADAVLCVRADSVGESNGPLLDAIGAGRASLVTDVGSAPEVAGDCARVVEPTVAGIRTGIEKLLDDGERDTRAALAEIRAAELTWTSAAHRYAELLQQVRCE